ncbi:MAG: hypothetical protein KAV00_01005 [Phycisphaerae bacterium]|nr:hypothetical protein [Phycisphaerae bacterium]
MSCGLCGRLEVARRAFEAPLWASRQGLLRARRRLSLPRAGGWYNLYRGASAEAIDFDAPVGQAGRGSSAVAEFPTLHPTGSGTYTYCVVGVGPGGHETDPDESAYYEITLENGVRVAPPPTAPVSFSVQPYRDGQALFTVVVDQSRGRVPTATLHCYNDGGAGGAVDYGTQVGPNVPVPTSGRHVLRFVIDPGLAHESDVGWSVRALSAESVEEQNTQVAYALVDSEGPPSLSSFTVECQADGCN